MVGQHVLPGQWNSTIMYLFFSFTTVSHLWHESIYTLRAQLGGALNLSELLNFSYLYPHLVMKGQHVTSINSFACETSPPVHWRWMDWCLWGQSCISFKNIHLTYRQQRHMESIQNMFYRLSGATGRKMMDTTETTQGTWRFFFPAIEFHQSPLCMGGGRNLPVWHLCIWQKTLKRYINRNQ